MKILHTEASLGYGGQEMRIVKEAQGMANLGHQITIVCPQEAQIGPLAREHGLDVCILPIGRKKIRALFTLRRWLMKNPQDVINTHSSTDSWLIALATRRMKNRPAIVRTRHISAPIPKNFSSRWLYTKSCDRVVTTGEKLRMTLISENLFPSIHVISVRTGIDLETFQPAACTQKKQLSNIDKDTFIIGIVATLRSWKGHRDLIHAFNEFTKEQQNSRLLIVGDGPQWEALHNLVESLQIADKVIFTHRQKNVADWINCMDVFCLPSYANEGVPQALMQSQACGIPAITTLIGSIDEAVIVNKTAIIVSPQNDEEILQALIKLHDDPALRETMSALAATNAQQNFSSQQMVEQMLSVFSAAIESRPA